MWLAKYALILVASSAPLPQDISTEAKAYLNNALDLIEKHSIKRAADFKKIRQNAFEAAKNARTPTDTYPAIRAALISLADRHSFLMDPSTATIWQAGKMKWAGMTCLDGTVVQIRIGGPAHKAGIRQRMSIFEVNGVAPSGESSVARLLSDAERLGERFTAKAGHSESTATKYEIEPSDVPIWYEPQGSVIDGSIGYVCVPGFVGPQADAAIFASLIQTHLANADKKQLDGWIIDLRVNTGGNMYPMIAGLGPLLGERTLGSIRYPDPGAIIEWKYEAGAAYLGTTKLTAVAKPITLTQTDLPIAVVTSGSTASSGESVLIAFLGDRRVRTFGTPTYGVPTVNQGFRMPDGASLILCVALGADRTGKVYETSIPPDLAVPQDWRKFQADDDPTISAAKLWISQYSVASRGGSR